MSLPSPCVTPFSLISNIPLSLSCDIPFSLTPAIPFSATLVIFGCAGHYHHYWIFYNSHRAVMIIFAAIVITGGREIRVSSGRRGNKDLLPLPRALQLGEPYNMSSSKLGRAAPRKSPSLYQFISPNSNLTLEY